MMYKRSQTAVLAFSGIIIAAGSVFAAEAPLVRVKDIARVHGCG